MAAVAIKAAVIFFKKTCGASACQREFVCVFVFVPMPGPDARSSSSQGRSWRVVRSEIFCRLDKSKHTGHDCEPCMRSPNYNFGPHKDGRNHDDVRMEFVWKIKSVFKKQITLCLLSTKMHLFWAGEPFTLGCYWAHLNPRRPYYRFQINSRMLRLKGERGCALASTQIGASGRTDGRGLFPDPGPAPGKLSLAQTLSSTCRCPPGRFQQTPDYFKKGFQAGRLQEQSPALEQPRSCDSCLKCNLLLILMKCFLFVIKLYKIPALGGTLQI